MFNSADEVLKFIGQEEVQFVDVRFTDLPGTTHHFTFPVVNFSASVFSDGLMFVTTSRGRILALDPATGRTVWSYTHPGGYGGNRGHPALPAHEGVLRIPQGTREGLPSRHHRRGPKDPRAG